MQIAVVLVMVGLVAAFAPGLGELRERMAGAQESWLGVAVALELLSCLSYVLMVRPNLLSSDAVAHELPTRDV